MDLLKRIASAVANADLIPYACRRLSRHVPTCWRRQRGMACCEQRENPRGRTGCL